MKYITPEQYKIAEQNGISASNVYNRVYTGWSIERAITTPVHKSGEIKPKHVFYVREVVR